MRPLLRVMSCAAAAWSLAACATAPEPVPPAPPFAVVDAPPPAEVPLDCAELPSPVEACGDAQRAAVEQATRCAWVLEQVAWGRALAAKGLVPVRLPTREVLPEAGVGPVGQVFDRDGAVWVVGSSEVPARTAAGRVLLVESKARVTSTTEYPLCGCERVSGVFKPPTVTLHRLPDRPTWGGLAAVEYQTARVKVRWMPQEPCPKPP